MPTIPFLGRVLEHGAGWAQWAALPVLLDLWASFGPEPGFEVVVTPDGSPEDLAEQFSAATRQLSGCVEKLANDFALPPKVREAAAELLAYVRPTDASSAAATG